MKRQKEKISTLKHEQMTRTYSSAQVETSYFIGDTESEKEAYERYINSGFVDPSLVDTRIASDIEGVAEYDWTKVIDEDLLGGRLDKRFVRLDYKLFDELIIDIMQNGENTGYVTYLNEQNIRNYGTDAVPKKISAMVKWIKFPDNPADLLSKFRKVRSEVAASRILSFFKAKTVYNQSCFTDTSNYILSVDFIKPNQRFYSCRDLQEKCVTNTVSLEKNLEILEQELELLGDTVEQERKGISAKYNSREIKEQFIYSYLTRVYLLGDGDFCGRNCGFIVDTTTNEITLAPNYDLELSFHKLAKLNSRFDADMRFVAKNYPEVLSGFMEVVESLSNIDSKKKVPKYKKIINKCVPEDELADEFSLLIHANINTLRKKYLEITNESQPQ